MGATATAPAGRRLSPLTAFIARGAPRCGSPGTAGLPPTSMGFFHATVRIVPGPTSSRLPLPRLSAFAAQRKIW